MQIIQFRPASGAADAQLQRPRERLTGVVFLRMKAAPGLRVVLLTEEVSTLR